MSDDSEETKKETNYSEVGKIETDNSEATKKETEDSEATKKDTEQLEATTDESKESSLSSTPVSSPSKSTDQSLSSVSPALSSPIGPLSGRTEFKPGKVPKVSSIPGVGVRGVSAVLSQDTVRGGQCSSVFVAQVVPLVCYCKHYSTGICRI